MDNLGPVFVGAIVALVAGWGGEWLRFLLIRRREREENRRAFQLEHLLLLQNALKTAIRAAHEVHQSSRATGNWDSSVESEEEKSLVLALIDVRHERVLVQSQELRDLAQCGIIWGGSLYGAESESESRKKLSELTKAFNGCIDLSGEAVRSLFEESATRDFRIDTPPVEMVKKQTQPRRRSLL